jgi:hypothetical protein
MELDDTLDLPTASPVQLDRWIWSAGFIGAKQTKFVYEGDIHCCRAFRNQPEKVTGHITDMIAKSDRFSGLTFHSIAIRRCS